MSTMRLKFAFEPTIGGVWGEEPNGDANDMVCVRVADFDDTACRVSTTKLTTRNISLSEQRGRVLQQGDLLLEKSGGGEQTAVGRTVLFDYEFKAVCSNFVALLRPKKMHEPRFLAYLSRAIYLAGGSIPHIKQTTGIQNLDCSSYLSQSVEVPDISKQRRIASYLDEQTAKIDRLMEMRRRQMALLKEQRAALIQQAVTRGLNPNAPMKDCGLPWLGEVPAHWEVVHFKRLLSLVEYGISERVDVEGRFICLRMGDLNFGEISFDGVAFVDAVDEGLLLRKGDLLFNRTNSLAQVGKVAIYRGNGDSSVTFASYLVRLRAGPDADSEYLNYLLNSEPILVWARSEAIPAIGQANLNPTRYCLLRVVKPPIEEQKAIVSYCVTVSRRIEDLLFAYTRQLELLKEYRAALIHECVTGQRAVSGVVAAGADSGFSPRSTRAATIGSRLNP